MDIDNNPIAKKLGIDSISLYRISQQEAQAKGICLECKKPALPNCYSEAGVLEYGISCLCELCFDHLCKDEDE